MNIKIPLRVYDLDKWKLLITNNSKIPEKEKEYVMKFIDGLQLGKINKGKKIETGRLSKYICDLKVLLEYFKKLSSKLTIKDIEEFEKDLSSDKIKTKFNKPYAHASKVDLKVCLRMYLRWRLKDKAIKLTDWFDVRSKNKTPDYLTEQEIIKLYKSCNSNEERFLLAVLFDAGCRAEEFHNIRKEDIQLPEGNDNFVKLTLKEEYSKTAGRVISLFWKYSLEAVRDYLNDRKEIKSDDKLFLTSYTASRQTLRRFGEKVLKKNITYHLFRHSSATYYATKINRQQLCYRYGWKFSSPMPDVYISRAGMENKELDEKFTSTELEEIKTILEKERQSNKINQEKLTQEIERVKKETEKRVFEIMKEQLWKKDPELKNYVHVFGSSMKEKPIKKN
jgi:integrase